MLTYLSTYRWHGVDSNGMLVKGAHIINNAKTLQTWLGEQDITLIDYKRKITLKFSNENKKLTKKQLHQIIYELALLLDSGINITQAIILLSNSYQYHSQLQSVLLTTQVYLEKGYRFSEALKMQKIYNDLIIITIDAGEKTNTLCKTLKELAAYQERMLKIHSQLLRALSYPIAVMSISFLITLIMLLFVVPQFKTIFHDFGSRMPIITHIIVWCSDFLKQKFMLLIAFIGTISLLAVVFYKKNKRYQQWSQKIITKLPIVKQVLTTAMLARWAQMTTTILHAGINIHEALEITSSCIGITFYEHSLRLAIEKIKAGQSLKQSLSSTALFPERVIELIAIGESSGNLIAMFAQIAKSYQQQFDLIVDKLGKWLEPAIMIILAILIGGIVIAMYLPIFQIGAAL